MHADKDCGVSESNGNPNPRPGNVDRNVPLGMIGEEDLGLRLADTQKQLDGLRDQLTESQRLATIGTIAAVIAHEFNNLLTPIVSYSQYALTSAESATPDSTTGSSTKPTRPNCSPMNSPTVRSDNGWVATARTN